MDGARFCPNCGSTVPHVPGEEEDPLLGKVIARNFRVESLLGTGGMGRVYKARQLSLDKPVVLKVLHPHYNNDPQLVQRFQREARAASRLNHPNSISIIDFGQADDGTLFMAMELLHGEDLFNLLQHDFPLDEERLGRIMIQVCSALAEAHEQNIIHRDLKPENIMVEDRRDQKDFVKVLDFGIAKIQDPSDGDGRALTQQGMVCGTPEYMSPEQARGEALDNRSDVYALGVLMYQIVTGDLPFKAETALGIVTKHITEAPLPPSQARPDLKISQDVEAIILKCLEKRTESRYQTATELGQAWKDLLETRQRQHQRNAATPNAGTSRTGTLALGTVARVSSAEAAVPEATARTEAALPAEDTPAVVRDAPPPTRNAHAAPPPDVDVMARGSKTRLMMGVTGLVLTVAAGVLYRYGPQPGDATPAPVESASSGGPAATTTPSAAEPSNTEPSNTASGAPQVAHAASHAPPSRSAGAAPSHRKPQAGQHTPTESPPTQPTPDGNPPDEPDGDQEAIADLVSRAQKRLKAGDNDEALNYLQKAQLVSPHSPEVLFTMATTYLAMGEVERACNTWKDALVHAPNHARAPQARNLIKNMCQ